MNYQPHEYQQYATDFIIKNPTAAVFLEMGLGKSVIALTAILELCLERFEISRVLVIAPLRVARDTWPAEIQKWDHLKDLTYSVAVGTANERRAALRQKNFVHIINRENVQWLIEDKEANALGEFHLSLLVTKSSYAEGICAISNVINYTVSEDNKVTIM